VLSALYWIFVIAVAVVMFPIAFVIRIVTAPFDRRRAVLHAFTCVWAGLYTWCNPVWRVEVVGREHANLRLLPDDTTPVYVIVANHLSLVDIFVLHRLFAHFKWVSKIENFKLPFIGWNMTLNGYVALRRGDKESVRAMLAECKRLLAAGSSILMFPEGTRSKTGELKAFKPGAFELAIAAGLQVLPVAVSGTFRALPKHGARIGRAAMRVQVLAPIASAGHDVASLSDAAHAAIARALDA
jgi:1-acyl-sn-glycerol-3-phosphate acyltransferase